MRRMTVATTVAIMTGAWGCGGDTPSVSSSTAEGKVKGTVKVQGKLATQGTVTFDPSNVRRKMEPARSAPIGKDGNYEITTLVGGNTVTVNDLSGGRKGPAMYPPQQFDVEPGPDNVLDIELGGPVKP